MDTVIVGNGIIALATAFRLAKRSKPSDKIVIIGKKARPGSATLAAAAMLNSFAEIDEDSLKTEADFFHFELSHLATRMWPKFVFEYMDAGAGRLPEGCAKCEGSHGACYGLGTYVINNTAADSLDDVNFNAIVAALKECDEPFEEISPRSIPNYRPQERYRATRAIYIPNEGWLNPRLTVDALEAALSTFSCVQYVDAEVDRLVRKGALIDSVVLKDGTRMAADKFLLAPGATATDLLAASALDIDVQRVFYGVGVSIEIKSPDFPHTKVIRTPNRGLACGLYSVPFYISPKAPLDSILIGSSNLISPGPRDGGQLVSIQSLLLGAMEQINSNFYRASVTRVNVGWRPTTTDTYPLLGKTSIANLVIATGTKRDGFHLSPVLSEALASMLLNEKVDPSYELFRPERAPIRHLSREAAIDKAVRHFISASYQHGFVPSHNRLPDQIIQMHRDDLEKLHDKVGARDWGIPPEMIEMYRYGHIKN
ncbi:MAG: FAD-binding oxidoreductase [Elusimicrobia bacterium]|nr:FAD-binding oxidoreductase [Elusimicrobiota bacterium]